MYCVEFTPIAEVAKEIVKANGFEDVITVYKGRMEDITLPVDQVDIIVSEWMGYFALFEGAVRATMPSLKVPDGAAPPCMCPDGIPCVHCLLGHGLFWTPMACVYTRSRLRAL